MEINKNSVYLVDNGATYLCIGITEGGAQAIFAPYWSDDEDCSPQIQEDEYMVFSNPYDGIRLKQIGVTTGRVELV